jgi:hypothetical protein
MSGCDVTNPSTQVSTVRSLWVPMTTSYRAMHLISLLPEDPTPAALLSIEMPPGVAARDLGTY